MPKTVYSLFNNVTISDNQFSSTFSGLLMLQLLVPILIGCLLDPAQMKQANPLTKTLPAHALTTLTRIGTQYPQVNLDQSKLRGTSLFYLTRNLRLRFI